MTPLFLISFPFAARCPFFVPVVGSHSQYCYSSINDGAAGGSLVSVFVSASNHLSSVFNLFNHITSGSRWFSLGLATVLVALVLTSAHLLAIMDIPDTLLSPASSTTISSGALNPLSNAVEVVIIEEQEIRLCRPAEPRPPGTIELPSKYEDGVFHTCYRTL